MPNGILNRSEYAYASNSYWAVWAYNVIYSDKNIECI